MPTLRRSDGMQPHLVNVQFNKRVAVHVSCCGVTNTKRRFTTNNTHSVGGSTRMRARGYTQFAELAVSFTQPSFPPVLVLGSPHARVWVLTQELHLYMDYRTDESYTPSRLAVRAGSAYHDLKVCACGGGVMPPAVAANWGGKTTALALLACSNVCIVTLHRHGDSCSGLIATLCYTHVQDVCIVELREPVGWIVIPLTASPTGQEGSSDRHVHAFFYQV